VLHHVIDLMELYDGGTYQRNKLPTYKRNLNVYELSDIIYAIWNIHELNTYSVCEQ